MIKYPINFTPSCGVRCSKCNEPQHDTTVYQSGEYIFCGKCFPIWAKEVTKRVELRIKKDGTVYLMGEEVGKAPHTLERVKRIVLVASVQGRASTVTIEGPEPAEFDELGLEC